MSAAANRSQSIESANAKLAARLVLPAWALIVVVFALPILGAVYLSFRNETLGGLVTPGFVGWENYRNALADPHFWESIWVTIIFVVLALLIQIPLGVGLAVLLHRNLAGTQIFRTILIIPMLLTPVAVGLIWRFLFDVDLGIVDWALAQVGLTGPNWIGSRWPAIWAVTIVDSWQSIPFVMLITLAGLGGLPRGPSEAAAIDGANAFQIFFLVTLPSLVPVILVTAMIRIIDVLKTFDLIYILTSRGGPGTATQTLGMLTYNTGFVFFQTSRGSALGVLMVILVAPIYVMWRKAARYAQ